MIRVHGSGWMTSGSMVRQVPDKLIHRETIIKDGSSQVKVGKKRTHKAFPTFTSQLK